MCQFCGCGDYSELDEDLREMAEYDVDMAYLEQLNRDDQAERDQRAQAAEDEWNDTDRHGPYHDWGEQARIHEHIERYDQDYD
ncbi:MAG: hypothetical protein ACO3F2_09870 [Roseiflexaceae bacterium]